MQKEFVKLSVDDIHPYPNNPRINDEAVAYVVESMNQTGNLDPIEIDENNVILSGHTRLLALEQLGVTETECVRYTGLTEEQKKKYRLLANKTGEVASWDEELLNMELGDLDFGGFDFGFELSDGGGWISQNNLTMKTMKPQLISIIPSSTVSLSCAPMKLSRNGSITA